LKLIAHGYKKITSTSNKTNNIATRKYFTENGFSHFQQIQYHIQNFLPFTSDDLFGPSFPETIMVPTTNPTKEQTALKLEYNLIDQIA
jgi:hypothetical protein